jgi:hypothetical protein
MILLLFSSGLLIKILYAFLAPLISSSFILSAWMRVPLYTAAALRPWNFPPAYEYEKYGDRRIW